MFARNSIKFLVELFAKSSLIQFPTEFLDLFNKNKVNGMKEKLIIILLYGT